METPRIEHHPVLIFSRWRVVRFTHDGRELEGYEGEPIAAALHAAGVRVLAHSAVRHRPRGLYCAIGNCSSCLMTVDGEPNVRVCVEKLREGMRVETQEGRGELRAHEVGANGIVADPGRLRRGGESSVRTPEICVIGAGPAGLCAALSAASLGAQVTLLDRNEAPGGQLVKQTHMFFGSKNQFAGTRGIDIAKTLYEQVRASERIKVLLGATALGYYPDGVILAEQDEQLLKLRPKCLIVATGAAEKVLPFAGNDLPGIYAAGAVQTLMNVHGVRPGNRVVMVGAGNIGLIVSYQLRQAGVPVAAIVEAAPTIGGYLVHASKIRRAGVPILTSHTVKEAYGTETLEGVIIHALDSRSQPVAGSEQDLACDVLCLAVGLTPLTELLFQAGCEMRYVRELGGHVAWRNDDLETSIPGIYVAGDVSGVEEASAAMVEGNLAGVAAAARLGYGGGPGGRQSEALLLQHAEELRELRCGPMGAKIRDGICLLAE